MGVSRNSPQSWTRSSHTSPPRDGADESYAEAITIAMPSILFTSWAATTCCPSHVSDQSKVASFQANMMPLDQPEAAMETYDSPLPQPSKVHVRCSGWVNIVSCKQMMSAPHSRRYRPTVPHLLSSHRPRTFQVMHFMVSRTRHPLHVRPP